MTKIDVIHSEDVTEGQRIARELALTPEQARAFVHHVRNALTPIAVGLQSESDETPIGEVRALWLAGIARLVAAADAIAAELRAGREDWIDRRGDELYDDRKALGWEREDY